MDEASLNTFLITVAYITFQQMTLLFLWDFFIFPYTNYFGTKLTHIMLLILFSVTFLIGLSS